MKRELSSQDIAILLMEAAGIIDDAIPNDSAPIVQNALREAARAVYEGRPAEFDEETIEYLDRVVAEVHRLHAALREAIE